jgi:hypothetical protein
MEDAEIDRDVHDVGLAFAATGDNVVVVAGRDDYMKHAPSAGGFGGWCRDVVNRMDMTTLKPVYSGFVVPGTSMGKATALIIQLALAKKCPVFSLQYQRTTEEPVLRRAIGIECIDPNDFFGGWVLDLE